MEGGQLTSEAAAGTTTGPTGAAAGTNLSPKDEIMEGEEEKYDFRYIPNPLAHLPQNRPTALLTPIFYQLANR